MDTLTNLLFISKILGLPLHPLVVHVVVILVPLSATGLLLTGWHPTWRRNYLLPLAILALVGAVGAFLATETGDMLESSLKHSAEVAGTSLRVGDHPDDGELARNLSILFAFLICAFSGAVYSSSRKNVKPWILNASYLVTGIVGIAATAAIVAAGHSGAALVWKDMGNFVSPSGH